MASIDDPLNAPLWRKLLALRVWALCILGLFLAFLLIGWLDSLEFDVPKWVETVFIVVAVLPFITFLYALGAGGTDLVVHFVPEGRIRTFLLKGDRSPETITKEFAESGYAFALLPFVVPVVLAVVALVLILIVGGVALGATAISTLWNSIFGGWPPWAVVITLLLVALLFKK